MVLGLIGCGSEGTTEEDTAVSVGSGVEFVEATTEPTEAPTLEPTETPTPEPAEAPTPEPTEAPTEEPVLTAEPEATTEPEIGQSEDGTNPAFYKWVSQESEESDIAWFTETYGVTEAELRTWDEEQWQNALYIWMYGEAPTVSNKKTIEYSVSVDGQAYSEAYQIEAETVYDVMIEAGFYNYYGIKEIRVNGVIIDDDPQNIPISDGDQIAIKAYDI